MDAIVQFLRNALCCIKDWELFPEFGLHDASMSAKFFSSVPDPINLTTPLEYLICITQFYAFVSGSISGLKMLTSRRYQRLEQLLVIWEETKKDGDKTAQRIISESLIKEMEKALRNLVVGICVFPIGFAFLWLAANSLHLTSTNLIGGLPALIHALTVMEVFLLPLLYFMWTDGAKYLVASKRILSLKKKLDLSNGRAFFEGAEVNAVTYSWVVSSWSPFWQSDDIDLSNQVQVEKSFANELKEIDANVKELSKKDGSKLGTNAANLMEASAWKSRREGQREYLCKYNLKGNKLHTQIFLT